jgi:hypothetical protein
LRAEKLRQADHLRALFGGGTHLISGPAEIIVRVGGAVHLNQADGKRTRFRHQQSLKIAKIANIAEIYKLRVARGSSMANFGNRKSVQEYQKLAFDSAARSVYFLKFARPRPSPEVKH